MDICLVHNKPFDDLAENSSWDLEEADAWMYHKQLQVPKAVVIGWLNGLTNLINISDQEEWFNTMLSIAHRVVYETDIPPNMKLVIALKIQYVFEGSSKGTKDNKKNQHHHPHVEVEECYKGVAKT